MPPLSPARIMEVGMGFLAHVITMGMTLHDWNLEKKMPLAGPASAAVAYR